MSGANNSMEVKVLKDISTAQLVYALRHLRWTLLVLSAVAAIQILMLGNTFPAKDAFFQRTVGFWLCSIPPIATSICLVAFSGYLKAEWRKPISMISNALLVTVVCFHVAWTVSMTGG